MLPTLFAAALATASPLLPVPPAACDEAAVAPRIARDSALTALFTGGQSFPQFLAEADDRRRQWERTWDEARIEPDVLASARGLKRRWRLLVIAVDSCSDSVNTVPYLARLEAEVPAIRMRIVPSSAATAQMESHRTPDGRPATPTVIILDESGNEAGCWIERPAALQRMAIEARAAGRIDEFQREKQGWYDRDAGASTVREVVEALVTAESGGLRCDAKR